MESAIVCTPRPTYNLSTDNVPVCGHLIYYIILHNAYILFLQGVCVKWSCLRLPWVDLDWFIEISCQIRELDISSNCLTSLPSVVPWGLLNLQKLNLSDNQLSDLPSVQSSDEIICSRSAIFRKCNLYVNSC